MPIELRLHKDGTTGLVAVCDVCGDLVHGPDANVCWRPTGKEAAGDFQPYRIACKDACTRLLDQQCGHQWTQELDVALVYLLNNTRTNLKSARDRAELMATL